MIANYPRICRVDDILVAIITAPVFVDDLIVAMFESALLQNTFLRVNYIC